ncbi:hypothetical protein LTR09_010752 [Extremus antarcticus]|uniref:TMEM205-like domain-containing protein n=1 Tax=Extremus antarcticus TaxID=702011 RepID=A0AAJ0DDB1_9PEZI|nr:hypothetical protein LTR09_010752 [Extremus antarcticus]
MPSLSSFTDPRAYHILTYGTLLGSTFFQTFMAGPLAYIWLPKAQFSTLQQKIFPPFFSLQTALPLLLALTWPGEKLAGAAGVGAMRQHTGWRGLIDDSNMWTALVPIGLMFGTSLLNLVWLGPATTKVLRERKHQGMVTLLGAGNAGGFWLTPILETRDGKKYHDPAPHSEAMQRLNSSFAMLHGLSSLSNVFGLLAMLYYGVVLGEKI